MSDIGPLIAALAIYMAVTAALIVVAAGRLRLLAQRHNQQLGSPSQTRVPRRPCR